LGESEEAYEVFREWSERSPERYNEEACRKKWGNVGQSPNGWTIGSVISSARTNKVKVFVKRVQDATDMPELEKVFTDPDWLAYPSVKPEDVEPIAKIYKQVGTALSGKTINIATARKAVEVTDGGTATPDELAWLDDLVYVDSFKGSNFYIISTGERLSADAINGRYHNELYILKKALKAKTLSIKTVLTRGMLTICSDHAFNPTTTSQVFTTDRGGKTLNLFNADSRPHPALEYTEKGLELIEKFNQHLEIIMSKDEAKILLSWLAWSAQNFGSKILWTPLIQSEEGLGKSIIGNVMINHVFGASNSGTVDSNVVVSPQTSWATNGVLRVLEEIKLAGHNRFEVLNQLKPFITNDTVSRVEKYEASSEVRNYTNFLAFTNFKDAIPVTGGDRRWWVVFARLNSLEELEKEVGMGRDEYFTPLHELVGKTSPYGAEFYKYLLEYDVEGFRPNFAPASLHKERMIATEDSKTNHLSELRDLIAIRSKGVIPEVLSTRQLKKLMTGEKWDGAPIPSADITTLLRKLGYTRFPKTLKSEKEVHNLWFSKAGMSDEQVRSTFHESMKLDISDGFDDLDISDL